MAPRGQGRRQRQQHRALGDADVPAPTCTTLGDMMRRGAFQCEEVKGWLLDWAWGKKSARGVQRDAKASLKDMEALCGRGNISKDLVPWEIRSLSKLGGGGKNAGNAHRDLQILLGNPIVPFPSHYDICVKNGRARKGFRPQADRFDVSHPIHLPHELFAHFFHNDKDMFRKKFLPSASGATGGCDTLEEFWAEMLRRPLG